MPSLIERSTRVTEVSLQMEELSVTDTCKELCRKPLSSKITMEQYLALVIPNGNSPPGNAPADDLEPEGMGLGCRVFFSDRTPGCQRHHLGASGDF